MHLPTLLLTFTTAVVSAATSSTSAHNAQMQACLADTVVETKTIEVGERTIEVTTVDCPALGPLAPAAGKTFSVGNVRTVARRDATECTNRTECQCGMQCDGGCTSNNLVLPDLEDCLFLAETLLDTEVNAPLFTIQPGQLVRSLSATCEFVVFNLLPTEIEFCNDDFGVTAFQIANACIPAGFDAGICTPTTGAFAVEFVNSLTQFD